jgi:hypothetical protein
LQQAGNQPRQAGLEMMTHHTFRMAGLHLVAALADGWDGLRHRMARRCGPPSDLTQNRAKPSEWVLRRVQFDRAVMR